MLSITKLQNLKAIHNTAIFVLVTFNVVINHKTTKFEAIHNSNQILKIGYLVVINHKTTKFESNSQLLLLS